MKKIYFIVISLLLLNNITKAQIIKSYDCVIDQMDTVIIYHLKVKFDSIGKVERRIDLVKAELEKKYQVNADKIISIESFIDKKYLTYRYRIKVKKE